MNVRVGNVVLLGSLVLAAIAVGCSNKSTTPTPTPTPTSSSTFSPDTLWVDDATSRTVRAYKGASTINGGAIANVFLNSNDNARPDVVYDPTTDRLWYPNQTVPNGTNNSIDIWTMATMDNNMLANIVITSGNTNNLEGAAVFDSLHNLLIVAHNTGNTVDVYSGATTMTAASVPAGFVTLTMTDGGVVGTPRPQEMLYDPVRDILFVTDNGTVCAKFTGFGAAAAALSGGTTITLTAATEISGLGLGNGVGLGYNSSLDLLFVTEQSPAEIDVIKTASTFNGATTHSQTITNFSNPSGVAYDAVRDILFVYDPGNGIVVLPNGSTASGNENSWPNRRIIFDLGTSLSGFGMTVDTVH